MKLRTQAWFFFAEDCEGELHRRYPDMPDIEIELIMMNGDSHLS